MKTYKLVEGDFKNCIVYTLMNSPVFFISERDVYDKRLMFKYENLYYVFTSSLDENYFPQQKDVVRCKNVVNLNVFTEDEEYFYYLSLSQTDIKVS